LPSAGINPATTSPAPTRAPLPSPPSQSSRHKRHLKNYLLDPSLQLRYVAFVTLLAAAICGVFGYLIWAQKSQASQVIIDGIRQVEWIDAAMKAEITRDLHASDVGILYKMGLFALGLILVLSGFLIVMTHKVAGPLYKVAHYFMQLRDNKVPTVTDLRRGDQFHDFFERFKEMNEAVRARTRSECDLYDRFLRACEQQSEIGLEVRNKLEGLAEAKREKEASLA
jgi:uncharacterized metal-binding protein